MLSAFFGESVPIFVLDEAIEVKVGDAFSNSCLSHVEVCVFLNALPEIALQHSQANVTLILDFVHVNDVEDHVVVFVQFVHGRGVGC